MLWSFCENSFPTNPGTSYVTERAGKKTCSIGSTITTMQDCRDACNELNKEIGVTKRNKPCYIAGNGKCRQDGRHGARARLVCMNKGNVHYVIFIQIHWHIIDFKRAMLNNYISIILKVNGIWGDWGEWGSCPVTCGGGWQVRNRRCMWPDTNNKGYHCNRDGSMGQEFQKCNNDICPSKLSPLKRLSHMVN